MLLSVWKFDVHPDKQEAFLKWTESVRKRLLSTPGLVELCSYRGYAGAPQTIVTYQFADLAAWVAWASNEEPQKAVTELRTLAVNVTHELWGSSPLMPTPIRPGK